MAIRSLFRLQHFLKTILWLDVALSSEQNPCIFFVICYLQFDLVIGYQPPSTRLQRWFFIKKVI